MVWQATSKPIGLRLTDGPLLFSTDSRLLFVCCENQVKVFSTATTAEVRVLKGHTDIVTRVLLHPQDPSQVYTSSLDGTIKRWRFDEEELVEEFIIGNPITHMELDTRNPQNLYVVIKYSKPNEGTEKTPNSTGNADGNSLGKKATQELKNLELNPLFEKKARVPRHVLLVHLDREENGSTNREEDVYATMGVSRKVPTCEVLLQESHKLCGLATRGEFVAVITGYQLHLYNVDMRKNIVRIENDDKFTTVKFHPTEPFIATGDSYGRIITWYCLSKDSQHQRPKELIIEQSFQPKSKTRKSRKSNQAQPLKRIYQWHTNGVSSLCFTADGHYMISGGEEAVIVIWNLETAAKKFATKLGGSVVGVSSNHNGRVHAVTLSTNTIKLVDALGDFSYKTIQGFRKEGHLAHGKWLGAPLTFEPRENLLVSEGQPGHLQFYSPLNDRFVSELQVSRRNPITRIGHAAEKIPETQIERFCFSPNGDVLVTLEHRAVMDNERVLKFWHLDSSQNYVLNTRVEGPHKDVVTAIVYHPTSELVVTTSLDKRFKIWIKMVVENPHKRTDQEVTQVVQSHSWVCRSVGTYKRNSPANAASFSSDGSLLAIAYDEMVSLWNPLTNTLMHELTQIPTHAAIRGISFIPNTPYIVTYTASHMTVWNLLTSSVWWSCWANVKYLAPDPDGPRFVVCLQHPLNNQIGFSNPESLMSYIVLFDASSPKPIVSWTVRKNVVSLAFLSASAIEAKQAVDRPSICRSLIVYLTAKQEVYVLQELQVDQVIKHTEEPLPIKEKFDKDEISPFESVYGKLGSSIANKKPMEVEDAVEREKQTDTQRAVATIFDAPSHVMPPISSLFKSFVDMLVIKDDPLKHTNVEQPSTRDEEGDPMDVEELELEMLGLNKGEEDEDSDKERANIMEEDKVEEPEKPTIDRELEAALSKLTHNDSIFEFFKDTLWTELDAKMELKEHSNSQPSTPKKKRKSTVGSVTKSKESNHIMEDGLSETIEVPLKHNSKRKSKIGPTSNGEQLNGHAIQANGTPKKNLKKVRLDADDTVQEPPMNGSHTPLKRSADTLTRNVDKLQTPSKGNAGKKTPSHTHSEINGEEPASPYKNKLRSHDHDVA